MVYVACVQKQWGLIFKRILCRSGFLTPTRAVGAGAVRAGRRMALVALNDDALGIISDGLCNTLEPRIVMAFSSANRGLWALTPALRQQLRADHEVAAALCLKMGLRSCKEL